MFIMRAYIIAGIAICPLLKMKGEEAIAIACAAFCIPTSMVMVLLVARLHLLCRAKNELHSMARSMRRDTVRPKIKKLS